VEAQCYQTCDKKSRDLLKNKDCKMNCVAKVEKLVRGAYEGFFHANLSKEEINEI